jgi:hypothetical protein
MPATPDATQTADSARKTEVFTPAPDSRHTTPAAGSELGKGLTAAAAVAGSDNATQTADSARKIEGFTPTPDSRTPTPTESPWSLLYAAVLAELVVLIVLFYAFTKAFA